MNTELRVLVVDDEPRSCSLVKHLIGEIDYPEKPVVIREANSKEEAEAEILRFRPDLLLLDVELRNNTAFDLLETVLPMRCEIIFFTAHEHYAIRAFRFSAVDFLLKPVDPELFETAFFRAAARLKEQEENLRVKELLQLYREKSLTQAPKRIMLNDLDEVQFVNIEDIISLEASGSYTIFHLADKQKITVSKNLHEYEDMLDGLGFFRVHRSFLIQLRHIKKYVRGRGGYVVMANGQVIYVAARKKEEFLSTVKTLG